MIVYNTVFTTTSFSSSLSTFINGTLSTKSSAYLMFTSPSSNILRVGPGLSTGFYVSDIRIYARALNASEVTLLATPCNGSTYSYGSGACSPCGAGANFVSAVASCMPLSGPTDTAFYLSGTQDEGYAAFSPTLVGLTIFTTDHLGVSASALVLNQSYLTAQGISAPALIPAGPGFQYLPFSASAWVKCQRGSPPFYALFFGNDSSTPPASAGYARNGIALVVDSADTSTSGSNLYLPACSGEWMHAAVTYDSMTMTGFVNGAQVGSKGTLLGTFSRSSSYLRIGPGPATGLSVSDVRIYARALSAVEVAQLATPCSGGTYSYGSGACSPCAAGATFVSAWAGCMPSTGPTDTAFYLSGTQTEGYAAFLSPPAGQFTFVTDHSGAPSGVISLGQSSIQSASAVPLAICL